MARRRLVLLGAEGRDLDVVPGDLGPHGPVLHTLFPDRVGHRLHDGEGLVRRGRSREVVVEGRPAEERIAHRPADEVDLVAGVDEPIGELHDGRTVREQLRE